MSRKQEICRDFQRGNCRYGSRCKFSHELPQQQNKPQQQNQNQRYVQNQNRNQVGGGGNYYNVLNNQPQQNQTQSPSRSEHRCNDPRVCREQIKEDMANEHPLFWRLTCYAHFKGLANDVVGDVSFEELRGHAYEGAKLGLSLSDVVQRERSMMMAKSAEFDALLRNPYRGSVQILPGSQPSFPPFGQAAALPVQESVQTPFGGAKASPFSFGQTGDVHFGKQSSPSPSPFGQQANAFGQSPYGSPAPQNHFGVAALPAAQSPFGGSAMPAAQSPFGVGALAAPQSPFGGTSTPAPQSPFGNLQSPFLSNVSPNQGSPVTPPFNSPPGFQTAGASLGLHTQIPASQSSPQSPPLNVELNKPQESNIWLKNVWKIGEIPEGEPPPEVRF